MHRRFKLGWNFRIGVKMRMMNHTLSENMKHLKKKLVNISTYHLETIKMF